MYDQPMAGKCSREGQAGERTMHSCKRSTLCIQVSTQRTPGNQQPQSLLFANPEAATAGAPDSPRSRPATVRETQTLSAQISPIYAYACPASCDSCTPRRPGPRNKENAAVLLHRNTHVSQPQCAAERIATLVPYTLLVQRRYSPTRCKELQDTQIAKTMQQNASSTHMAPPPPWLSIVDFRHLLLHASCF
jgi:hypothetical protein